jgi:hypothetical protein
MKKLIKIAVLIIAVAIFSFSQNTTISKARTFVIEKGKNLYEKGIEKMQTSKNSTVAKTGEFLK